MDLSSGNAVGFINPWTGEEMPGMAISDHDEDSLHGKQLVFVHLSFNSISLKLTKLLVCPYFVFVVPFFVIRH